jgi:tetratricopeptide (TPR) repeat protein
MGSIVPFKPSNSAKLGFKRAVRSRRRSDSMEKLGQLNLFQRKAAISREIGIRNFDGGLSTFEQALLLDDRDDPRAAEKYRQALKEGDCAADSLCNLGIIESRAGEKSKAFDCFTRSLRLEPRHFESHFNLANLYFDAGDYALAKSHYEFALEVDPRYPNLYYNLGLVLAMLKQFPTAVSYLRTYAQMEINEDGQRAIELANRIARSASMDGT